MGEETMSSKKLKLYNSEFVKRFISALVLIPIVLFVIYSGGKAYNVIISLIGCWMMVELYKMINTKKISLTQQVLWFLFAIVYALLPCMTFIYLRQLEPQGLIIMLWLIFAVWATDIGAYIVGTTVQGPKILPKISPKKTWSGALGGIISATIIGYIFDIYYPNYKYHFSYVSPIISIVAQCGDFLESAIKRNFGVKNSSNLIPGHGGILDRVDGLVTASLLVLLLELYI
jgi:phosphatidate cytidylyltransferase